MRINIITPINNINYLQNAICNYENQTYKNKRLLLILNGSLDNHFINEAKNKNIVILKSEENIGKARNVALDYCGNELFSNFDSDDTYFPNYLNEAYQIIKENGFRKDLIVGKLDFKIKHENDIYEIVGLKSNICHGPTITAFSNYIRYQEISLGEDVAYLNERITKGDKIINSSSNNFIYNKNGVGASKTNINQLLNQFKLFNSINNIDIKIYKNGKLIWKLGDQIKCDCSSDLISF